MRKNSADVLKTSRCMMEGGKKSMCGVVERGQVVREGKLETFGASCFDVRAQ